jgi:hypothetical protein
VHAEAPRDLGFADPFGPERLDLVRLHTRFRLASLVLPFGFRFGDTCP